MRAFMTAALLATSASQTVLGQEISDETLATIAAVEYWRDKVAPVRVGVDPRVLTRPAFGRAEWVERPEAEMSVITQRTGTIRYRREWTCTGPLKPCTLKDVDAYMVPSRPIIQGDTAVVRYLWVHNILNSTRRLGLVNAGEVELTLARSSSGWKVVRARTLSQT